MGLLVFDTIVATSISVLLTPGAVTGTFFCRYQPRSTLDVGPPDGTVVSVDALLDPAFEHADAISTIARPVTKMRDAYFLPEDVKCRGVTLTS